MSGSQQAPPAEKLVTSDLKLIDKSSLSFADRLLLKELEIATFNSLHQAVATAENLDEAIKYRSLIREEGVKKDLNLAEMKFDADGNVSGKFYVEATNRARSYFMMKALKPNENAEEYSDKQMAICNGLIFYPPAKANESMTPRIAQDRNLAHRIKLVSDTSQRNVFNGIKSPLVDKNGLANGAKQEIDALKPVYDLMNSLVKEYAALNVKDKRFRSDMQLLLSSVFDISNDPLKNPNTKLNEIVLVIQRSALTEYTRAHLLAGVVYDNQFVADNDSKMLAALSKILQAEKNVNSPTLAIYKKILSMKFDDRQKVNMIANQSQHAMQKRDSTAFIVNKIKYDNTTTKLHDLIKQYAIDPVKALKGIEALAEGKQKQVKQVESIQQQPVATVEIKTPSVQNSRKKHKKHEPAKNYQQPFKASAFWGDMRDRNPSSKAKARHKRRRKPG